MAAIRSFRDLQAYGEARKHCKVIFQLTKRFPKEERYSLIDQIRRSSRAVCALIAEGWGRRRYEAAFINKMNEALAEAMETQSWLDHSLDCEYITLEEFEANDDRWQHVGAMLNRIIQTSDKFCESKSKS